MKMKKADSVQFFFFLSVGRGSAVGEWFRFHGEKLVRNQKNHTPVQPSCDSRLVVSSFHSNDNRLH